MGQANELDYGGMTVIAKAFKLADQPGQEGTIALDLLVAKDEDGNIAIDSGKTLAVPCGSYTTTNNAATSTEYFCKITTGALTTVANASLILNIQKMGTSPDDMVFVQHTGGSNSKGLPVISAYTATSMICIKINNVHPTEAFNGTLTFNVMVVKKAV